MHFSIRLRLKDSNGPDLLAEFKPFSTETPGEDGPCSQTLYCYYVLWNGPGVVVRQCQISPAHDHPTTRLGRPGRVAELEPDLKIPSLRRSVTPATPILRLARQANEVYDQIWHNGRKFGADSMHAGRHGQTLLHQNCHAEDTIISKASCLFSHRLTQRTTGHSRD